MASSHRGAYGRLMASSAAMYDRGTSAVPPAPDQERLPESIKLQALPQLHPEGISELARALQSNLVQPHPSHRGIILRGFNIGGEQL